MSSGKRKPQASLGKQGGNPAKKVKTSQGDIPSSNFEAAKNKPKPKHSQAPPSALISIPKIQPNLKNPTEILRRIDLPDAYKDVMGPNLAELKKYAEAKAKKEKLAQSRIDKAKIPMLEQLKKEQAEDEFKPKEIIQDESGRIRDEHGNIINLKPTNASSLKVNINRAKEEKVKEILKLQRGTGLTANRNSKIFDPTLLSKSQTLRLKRKNNAFHFIEKGSITKKGEVLRSHAEHVIGDGEHKDTTNENGTLEKLQQRLNASDVQIGIKRVTVRVKRHDPTPDVEWWDIPLLPGDRKSYLPEENLVREKEIIQKEKYESEKDKKPEGQKDGMEEEKKQIDESLIERLNRNLEMLINNNIIGEISFKEKVNSMVEHPALFKTEGSNQNVVIPVYLTKDERKKLRRKKRLEREKDKQEKIRLGLMKPPPPKLKYSNFMNIMKDEAVADPTRVEMEIKKATAERLQAHLDRNAKRKLTKEQKAEKYMRKLKRDSALECRVAVFRIDDLSHGALKFKVSMNAQQLALNGVCIIADKRLGLNLPNVVVVEGGPKAIKKYKKLMLRRIRWNIVSQKDGAAAGDGEADKAPQSENKCVLVWEGILKDHNFNKWKVAEIKSELEGRRLLTDRGVEFYWDRALTNSAIEDEEN